MSDLPVLVILSGSGHLDGSEVREAVILLLALDRSGLRVQIAAPDMPQLHVVDHLTGAVVPGETRNVLMEAARIARGQIVALAGVDPAHYAGVFLPGGFGAAKNLSTLALRGPVGAVQPDVARVLQGFHAQGKPIGAVCIAPALVVRALGEGEVTVGDDARTASTIRAMGGSHVECPVDVMHVDRARKIVTAPAYMYGDASISGVARGIEAAVAAFKELLPS